jgi:GNAT superfamily N-acetyltransferase
MTPVRTAGEVFEAIQKVKAGAAAFCTNFFPVQSKLENWVAHQELSLQSFEGCVFFLRKDRDFAHLYFCAGNPAALGDQLPRLLALTTEKLSTDLVGPEASLVDLQGLIVEAGFSRYSRLVRLARPASTPIATSTEQVPAGIEVAAHSDAPAILRLIESSFDRFADQLPAPYEIEGAIAARQIFVIKQNGKVAALLFFETQGLTSTIRYWLVAKQFHSRGFGSALIRHYFLSQAAVRRFILWVTATNDNAIQKYQHYGYAPDGLIDRVLVHEPAKD